MMIKIADGAGGQSIDVRPEYYQTGNGKWRWRAYAVEDDDRIADARSGRGFDTQEEAEENFRRAALAWSVDTEEETS